MIHDPVVKYFSFHSNKPYVFFVERKKKKTMGLLGFGDNDNVLKRNGIIRGDPVRVYVIFKRFSLLLQ